MTPILDLHEQPGRFAIARLAASAGLPDWFPSQGLRSATWAEDELSLIVPETCVPSGVASAVNVQPGWVAVQVKTLAALDEPGVVLAAVRPISEAGLGVFVTSTHLRDYLLVRADKLSQARAVWLGQGHLLRLPGKGAATLRLARDADAPELAALHARVSAQTYGALMPPEALPLTRTEKRLPLWVASLAQRPGPVYVIERGGAISGFCALRPSQIDGNTDALELSLFYLDGSEQGRGTGRVMLDLALAHARLQNAPALVLSAVEGNSGAIGFYEHCGGRQVGRYTDPGPVWRSQNLIFRWDL